MGPGRFSKPAAVSFVAAAALAACQGAMPSAYVPQGAGLDDSVRQAASSDVTSTCGTGVSAADKQIVRCQFSQAGYSGKFTVDDTALAKAGLASVTPLTGTAKTQFAIEGDKKTGFGTFTVAGAPGHSLTMQWGQLPSADHTVCAKVRRSSQNVTVPATGGLTVAIGIDAYPKGTTGCAGFEVATGADAQKVLGDPRMDVAPNATAPVHPLFTITLGEAFGSNPLTGGTTIVSGMAIKTSPDLQFPDGVYVAKIDKGGKGWLPGEDTVQFVAKDGVLRVILPKPGQDGRKFPIVIPANSSYVLAVYPIGTTSIPGTPKPSASPSSSASPTASASPIPTQPPDPGAVGNPPPAYGANIGTMGYSMPDPPCTGVPYPCEFEAPVIVGYAGISSLLWLGFFGTAYVHENLGYMQLANYTIHCPNKWHVQADLNGNVELAVPRSHAMSTSDHSCWVHWTTLPKGSRADRYYEWWVVLSGIQSGS